MEQISWKDFEQVELRVGTIIEVEDFPQARKDGFILAHRFLSQFLPGRLA